MGIWPLFWASEDSNTFWDQNIRKKHVIGPSQIRETLTLQIGGLAAQVEFFHVDYCGSGPSPADQWGSATGSLFG